MDNSKKSMPPPGPFQAGRVLILAACHFIHDIYSAFLAPLLPLLIDKLGMSLTQAGFLSTAMQLPHLLNPFIGNLADRVNVRYFVILAPVTTAVPMSLIGLAPSYGILLILLFITGLSTAVFHVPAPVMIAQVSGSQVGKGMSFYMTGGEFARTLGPLAAVGAVSLFGLEGFYPIMIFGILASSWLFLRFRSVDTETVAKPRQSLGQTWTETRHVLGPLVGILVARGFMHAAMSTFLPTYLKQQTGSIWIGGFGLMALEAAGVAGILIAGPMSDRFGRRRVLLVSLMGAPLGLFLFVLSHGPIQLLAIIITGLTLLSTTPVMLALVQEQALNSPAAANGIFMMVSFMARSATVVLVGVLADQWDLKTAYLLSASAGLAGLPFIFLLPASRPSKL